MKRRWVLALPILGLSALGLLLLKRPPTAAPAPGTSPTGSSEQTSGKSYKLIYPAAPSVPGDAVTKAAVAPPVRHVRLNLFAHDGRPLKYCRVIALGRDRVYGEYDPEESAKGSASVELDLSGNLQRIVVIPQERDLAVLVQDVNLDRGEAPSLVLARGMQVGGTVVDPKGTPVVNANVYCEVPLPPEARSEGLTFASIQDKHERFTVVGDTLTIFADSDAQGNFSIARLPESAANVTIALGKRSISQAGAGLSMRVVLPDADPK